MRQIGSWDTVRQTRLLQLNTSGNADLQTRLDWRWRYSQSHYSCNFCSITATSTCLLPKVNPKYLLANVQKRKKSWAVCSITAKSKCKVLACEMYWKNWKLGGFCQTATTPKTPTPKHHPKHPKHLSLNNDGCRRKNTSITAPRGDLLKSN